MVKEEPEAAAGCDDDDRYQCELFCVSPDEPTPERMDSSFGPDNATSSSFDNGSIRDGIVDNAVTMTDRQPPPQTRTNSLIPDVSFRDIIGQGPAKLRLDEALLPLALPADLAESVLTGTFVMLIGTLCSSCLT